MHTSRSPPPTRAGDTPLFHCLISNKVKLLKISLKKIPTFIAFSKVSLGDVKVEILLISCYFLVFICMRPSPAYSLTSSFYGKQKVLRWYISGQGFIYVWYPVATFLTFKCFHSSRKFDFRLLLGGFLAITPSNVPSNPVFVEVHYKIYLQEYLIMLCYWYICLLKP